MQWGTMAAVLGCVALLAGCGKSGDGATGKKGDAADKPAAATGPPKSFETLIDAAIAAIKARDEAAFAKLMVKAAHAKKLCPGLTAKADVARMTKEFTRERDKLGQRFAGECGAVDWANAKLVTRTGGEARKPNDGCPGVTRYGDVKLHFEVGGKHVEVELENPIGKADSSDWYFFGAPECELHDGPPPVAWPEAKKQMMKLAETFNNEACACADADCATKKIEAYMNATAAIAKQHKPPESETKELLALQEKGLACFQKLKKAAAAKPE